MTDAQMMTLATAVIAALSLLIYLNNRITDAKGTLRAEMQTLKKPKSAGTYKLLGTQDIVAGLHGSYTGSLLGPGKSNRFFLGGTV